MSTLTKEAPLLEVRDLSVIYRLGPHKLKAVNSVSFAIQPGETLGLVGESGCGKSTLGKAILQLVQPTSGQIYFDGREITHCKEKKLRREMQMIFQDPLASLNPRMSVGEIIREPLVVHKITHQMETVYKLLDLVGLSRLSAGRYPHEFSGGQRQRIGIARALSLNPRFLVCDEPISALDISIQAQIVNLLQDLQKELHLTYLFIAHDLSMVRYLSTHVAVMYLGELVEIGPAEEVYKNPLHPYTQLLLSSIPLLDPIQERKRVPTALAGEIPSPLNPPSGCVFSTRCPMAKELCKRQKPVLQKIIDNRQTACHYSKKEAMTDEPALPPKTAFEYRAKAPHRSKGEDLYFISEIFCERPSGGTFVAPYNMVQALGFKEAPKIVRAAHATAYLLGPQITVLLSKLGAEVQDLDVGLNEIDPEKLYLEVIQTIKSLQEKKISAVSLPAAILQNPLQLPEIENINQFAAHALGPYDGLALSGGSDVEIEFYTPSDQTPAFKDYRRSMAEFALMKKASEVKKPILGICRGGQILNVYFGGTLRNVAERKKWQSMELTDSSKKKELETLLGSQPLVAYASHHQACHLIANGFEVVLCGQEKIPEMIWSKDGLCLGTQFHPEYPCDGFYSSAIEIFQLFFKKIKETN